MEIDRVSSSNEGGESVEIANLFLDQVGEVALTLVSDSLSWKLIESLDKDGSNCLGVKMASKSEICINISDVYAVEYANFGVVREPVLANAKSCLMSRSFEMHRMTVHTVQRSKNQICQWVPTAHTFGLNNLKTCQIWVDKINACIEREANRPKSLLVFVHPRSGKGNGFRIWESVAPIFSRAKVKTNVTITQRAGHAYDAMASITNKELSLYDGVVAVGGDGFFNELLNGLLLSRHKAPSPPPPADIARPNPKNDNNFVHDNADISAEHSREHNEDESPLLLGSNLNGSQVKIFGTADDSCNTDKDHEFSFPNDRFRFGIIPSGSTDAIVICTTGIRDAMTSALQIVLGARVCLDIAQIAKWKSTSSSEEELSLRYAASFAGYGFYGDVIKESEKYRWMGPKRYDYAGTKVFLKHRSYEAEVAYLKLKSEKCTSSPNTSIANSSSSRRKSLWNRAKKSERVICRVNCKICNTKMGNSAPDELEWVRCKDRFLSVGAAVMSNRNEKAPDGLVAEAHLSDGFLHLILIKDCPHALYLWHLTQLAKKGGTPLDFEFVEHHKTTAFTFTSFGKESIWNVDGELFKAHKLSAQVFRGLINIFATGPQL